MASDIESIFDELSEAMEAHGQAVEVITDGFNQLRTATRKLESAYDKFANWIGQVTDSSGYENSEGFQIGLGLLNNKSKGFDLDNLFDIGSLF